MLERLFVNYQILGIRQISKSDAVKDKHQGFECIIFYPNDQTGFSI